MTESTLSSLSEHPTTCMMLRTVESRFREALVPASSGDDAFVDIRTNYSAQFELFYKSVDAGRCPSGQMYHLKIIQVVKVIASCRAWEVLVSVLYSSTLTIYKRSKRLASQRTLVYIFTLTRCSLFGGNIMRWLSMLLNCSSLGSIVPHFAKLSPSLCTFIHRDVRSRTGRE